MIRLAFLAVILVGGLIAFGAYSLVRGSGGDAPAPEIAEAAPETPTEIAPEPEAPAPTPLYFLSDVDLAGGLITVVLRDAITGQGDLVVRDQAAITAAKDSAYINTDPTQGIAMAGADPQNAVVEVYSNDSLIAAVDCTNTACATVGTNMDLGPLLTSAQPLIHAQTYADNYDDYLADLNAITGSPDYMFLDLHDQNATPQPRQTATMDLHLPTLVTPASTAVDPTVTSALVRSVLEPHLPDGAAITGVTVSDLGAGVVVDMDSGTPTLAGGAEIPFPDVAFTNLRVSVEGIATLSAATLQTITDQSPDPLDYTDAFNAFVRDRLQNGCTDCFRVAVKNGDHFSAATITQSDPEDYRLEYYDLRDPP